MPKKKNFFIEQIPILDYAAEGKCVARWNEKVVFVEGAVPGDVADLFVFKNKKDWAEARVQRLVQPSADRVDPFCDHFGTCGGCKWQMLPYELQLQYKEKQVKDQLQRIGKIVPEEFLPIIGCEENRWYRNKVEFTFSTKRYLSSAEIQSKQKFDDAVLGFHAPGFFDKVIPITTCYLQQEPTNAIRNFVHAFSQAHQYSYYDIKNHHGLLRTLMIRLCRTGELMVNIQFGEEDLEKINALLDALHQEFPAITSLNYVVNTKMNDTLYDQDIVNVYGRPYILEKLEDFQFMISPKSFFQTNSKQAEVLYQTVRRFAALQGHEVLYDLYCGTGSIGIFLSKQVSKIIGVETVPEAVDDAKKNAALNAITNAHFFAGDVIKICTDEFFNAHGKPDIVIIDPPRAGCHEKLIDSLLRMRAPRMVYVSCNPATQARDLALLQEVYHVRLSQAVDMFPHTHHIENVVLLELK
jgi:23S rRNA (uracil1939-C5)-methyltransferase